MAQTEPEYIDAARLICVIGTILTCSPFDIGTLCGHTLNITSYPNSLHDETSWCVQLTDTENNNFYLPLASCQTYYVICQLSTQTHER